MTAELAQAAIDGLDGMEANRALVKLAAELRDCGVEDDSELVAALTQAGGTEAQVEAAIASLNGLAAKERYAASAVLPQAESNKDKPMPQARP